jgi:signal recognition particle receptor subunit alpha
VLASASSAMLDFVSIFTKGGILLWCYQGAGLLDDELRAFRTRVNAFVRDVLLAEAAAATAAYESGSLAIKYRLDNEFELVFIAAYQKVLPLLYLDKLLDEIQLRFRDRYAKELKESDFYRSFSSFSSEFEKTLRAVETDSKMSETRKRSEMRSFEDSAKSKKTIASMIEGNNNKENKNQQANKKNKNEESTVDDVAEEPELSEEARQANLNALKMRKGPGKKGKSI